MKSKKHRQPTAQALALLAQCAEDYHSPEATAARDRLVFQRNLPKCPAHTWGVHEWTTIEKPFAGIKRIECRNCGIVP